MAPSLPEPTPQSSPALAGSDVKGEEEEKELTIDKMSSGVSGWLNDSGSGGQRVTAIDAILGRDISKIPLASLIPSLRDKHTNDALTDDGVLDRVYGWMRANRGEFTIDDVTDELMKHYVGSEPDKRAQIRWTVKSGMDHGRHLRKNPDCWAHPCVALCREVASHHSIQEPSRPFNVLV